MGFWWAIFILACIWIVIIGWACLVTASNADDIAAARYRREREAFERLMK